MLQTIITDERKDLPSRKHGMRGLLLDAEQIVHNFKNVILGMSVETIVYKNNKVVVRTKYYKKDFENNKVSVYCSKMNSCLNNLNMRIIREEHSCKEKCETIYSKYVLKRE